MKFPQMLENFALLALAGLSLLATPVAAAQTIISNETLVTTTFVVDKSTVHAGCTGYGCQGMTPLLASIPVTCPAATRQTCTFHISLETKVATTFPCMGGTCPGPGPEGLYQFLIDGAAPTVGPTNPNGEYTFEMGVFTTATNSGDQLHARQGYPASVVTSVTNTSSNSHTISVSVGCADADSELGGCGAITHWSTMRVDVFEP
jgi:hypothetical protein